jgi:hypothetical protein
MSAPVVIVATNVVTNARPSLVIIRNPSDHPVARDRVPAAGGFARHVRNAVRLYRSYERCAPDVRKPTDVIIRPPLDSHSGEHRHRERDAERNRTVTEWLCKPPPASQARTAP